MRSKAYYLLEAMFNKRQMEGRDAKLVVRFLMVALKHAEQSGEIRDTKKNSD